MNELSGILKTQAALTKAAPQLTQLKQACQSMEAAFMKTLVSKMREGTGDVHFGQELGGDIYRDMFDDQLANLMAQKEGGALASAMAAPMAAQVMAAAKSQVSRSQGK